MLRWLKVRIRDWLSEEEGNELRIRRGDEYATVRVVGAVGLMLHGYYTSVTGAMTEIVVPRSSCVSATKFDSLWRKHMGNVKIEWEQEDEDKDTVKNHSSKVCRLFRWKRKGGT